jgi:hypothetical protein
MRLALNVGLDPSIFPVLDPSGSIQKSAVLSNNKASKEFQALLKAIESQNIGIKIR